MVKMKNPRVEYKGKIEGFPLENYPDYVPGKAPQAYMMEDVSYLDEAEAIWGKNWGACGIGKLKEVALIRPTELEINPLWGRDRDFFLLRREGVDLGKLTRALEAYAKVLEAEGVTVHWMESKETWGPYGPLRRQFMAGSPLVVRGGAIFGRPGHASYLRGRINKDWFKFFAEIECPVIHMVHGKGICEVGTWVPVAEDVIIGMKSSAANDDGIEQVVSVLHRSGVTEVHIAHGTTIAEDFRSGGDFHLDMIFGTLDLGVALVYPAHLDYQTYRWLRSKKFRLIEVPPEEHLKCSPANLVILEPGKVIISSDAKETIRRVRSAGIEVIDLEASGLQVGVNGIRCVTMQLRREPGPSINDIS
jgi:N-dimethylarginine dimethylaminohydrolase